MLCYVFGSPLYFHCNCPNPKKGDFSYWNIFYISVDLLFRPFWQLFGLNLSVFFKSKNYFWKAPPKTKIKFFPDIFSELAHKFAPPTLLLLFICKSYKITNLDVVILWKLKLGRDCQNESNKKQEKTFGKS